MDFALPNGMALAEHQCIKDGDLGTVSAVLTGKDFLSGWNGKDMGTRAQTCRVAVCSN